MILPKSYACRVFTVITLFSITLLTLGGCSTSNYGQLKSNPEVTRSFQGYQILPGHKFYYRGVYTRPTVIVGINQNYKLNLKLWVAIDPESDDFRILIDRVSLQGMGRTVAPWGFTILDKAGNDVGVWYSALRAAAVEIDANGQITMLAPMGQVAIGNQPQ